MKEKYITPDMELIWLYAQDIVTISDTSTHPEDDIPGGNEGQFVNP